MSTAEYMREWRKKNPDKASAIAHTQRENHREARRIANREWSARLRDEALTAYGGVCACCGESRKQFLAIDHANNDGAEHRKQIGRSRITIWLKQNDWPGGFQILCHNCNLAKSFYGYCHLTS